MSKVVAIYVRVSTGQQDHRSQLPDLEKFAESQEDAVLWYKDTASGKTMDRPGWRRLEADIRKGRVGKLAVWRLDRLGRTAKGLTSLFEDLQERKVTLVSLTEGLDLSTPAGRLMANVIASVAQYETELRGERVRAGQAAAKAQGKSWGGSEAGVRKKVTPDQMTAIHKLRLANIPVARIAEAVGLTPPTVYSVLRELNWSVTCPSLSR